MPGFNGFPEGAVHLTPIPDTFFSELLPQITHLGELKLTLYVIWRLARMEGKVRYLSRHDLDSDVRFLQELNNIGTDLDECLSLALQRGALLEAHPQAVPQECYYFLNTPKGRAAAAAIQNGEWLPNETSEPPQALLVAPPNIYRLYEENIGALTPMIADVLKVAENTYPTHWIEDALQIAVEKNKRNWRYVEAILERWRREGRDARREKQKDRGDSEEARRRYVEGQLSDFIEH
jgi:DnaD/phage-associated family protein